MFLIIILNIILMLVNPFIDVTIGRCIDNMGNGKEYNGESYYNYIKYDETKIHENDIVVTGFILNTDSECEYRVFDAVVLKNAE